MAHNTILLADNDEDFIEITTEFLEKCGFEVMTATNPLTAHQILLKEQARIQVAVFDSRLMNDLDEYDTSGIELARLFGMVPSIIMTRFPSVPNAVEALRPLNGRANAKDYVDKRDGLDVLLQAIQNVLPLPSLVEIHQKLMAYFNESDLRHLCFTLNIEYDNLTGKTRRGKARELVLYFEKQERLAELVATCRRERPLQFP
ncbi:MAG: hypothetical protein H6658_01790 [Ardenticatenaceae bacterium]|nr:hypothetical protein [Ardenticatenaceae bacterium]